MKFYIKQKVFSFKDKFNITDENQNLKYQVQGKVFTIRNKLEMQDANENVLYKSQKKLFRLFANYLISEPDGGEVANIKRKFSLRPKFDLSILNEELTVDGSLFAHSFGIYNKGEMVASISKKIISWGDTYEIEIFEEKNVELFLFVVIILDQVIHEGKKSLLNF
ncbi:MAG: LURP-one-related family protein [Tenericutes bacterium]|nr:LURP-one-related family protein [Mycoplasmatota bacterium]